LSKNEEEPYSYWVRTKVELTKLKRALFKKASLAKHASNVHISKTMSIALLVCTFTFYPPQPAHQQQEKRKCQFCDLILWSDFLNVVTVNFKISVCVGHSSRISFIIQVRNLTKNYYFSLSWFFVSFSLSPLPSLSRYTFKFFRGIYELIFAGSWMASVSCLMSVNRLYQLHILA